MRGAFLIVALAVCAARITLAQAPGAGSERSGCNVVAQSTEVDDEGRFVRPPPTPDQCLFAAALVTKFLEVDAKKVRRTTSFGRLPYPVQAQIGTGLDYRDSVIWVVGELVIIAYLTDDFTGAATNVLVADVEAGTACRYLRWPTGELPRQLSLRDIQELLAAGRSGDESAPTCYLRELEPLEPLAR
jgi:hypothetical protein